MWVVCDLFDAGEDFASSLGVLDVVYGVSGFLLNLPVL